MSEFTMPIPARLKNVAINGHVAGTEDIIDDALGKTQKEINTETSEKIEEIKGGSTDSIASLKQSINNEKERAESVEEGLSNRLSDVEQLAKISIDGGEAKIATGEDFDNPTAEQRVKIPTVGAVLDGADYEPIAGSDNLVKSGGVYSEIYGKSIPIPTVADVLEGSMTSAGDIVTTYELGYIMINVSKFRGATITVRANYNSPQYAFLKSYTSTNGVFCDGCEKVNDNVINVIIPSDANYLYYLCGSYSNPILPYSIVTSEDTGGIKKEISGIEDSTRPYINQDNENIALCVKNANVGGDYCNINYPLPSSIALTNIGDYFEFCYKAIDLDANTPHRIFQDSSRGVYLDIKPGMIVVGNYNQSAKHEFPVKQDLFKWNRIRVTLVSSNITEVTVNGVAIGRTTMGGNYKLSVNKIITMYTTGAFSFALTDVVFSIGNTVTKYGVSELRNATFSQGVNGWSIIPFDNSAISNAIVIKRLEDSITPKEYFQLYGRYPVKQKTLTGSPIIISDKSCNYQLAGEVTKILSANRFKESAIHAYANSYNSRFVFTAENYGIHVSRAALETPLEYGWIYAPQNYIAEYTGKLYISLDAFTNGKIDDLGALLRVNNVSKQRLTGIGHYVWEVDVNEGDAIELRLYLITDDSNWLINNDVIYKNIMFQYGIATDFLPNEDDVITRDSLTPSCIIEGHDNLTLTYDYIDSQKTIKCVCVGDSITGMYENKTGYPDVLTRISDVIEAVNCGFPGNTLSLHNPSMTIQQDAYNAFSFVNVVDAIVSGNYQTQLDNISNIPESNRKYYQQSMNNLTPVDFSKVDFLVMLYGTNDWSSGRAFDSGSGTTKDNCFEDAFIYSVNKLMETFPNLNIIVLSPYWRKIPDLNINDSNVDAIDGLLLKDAAKKIYSYAKNHYNLPAVNLYEEVGVNVYTNRYFTMDNVHPNVKLVEIIAEIVQDLIKTLKKPL